MSTAVGLTEDSFQAIVLTSLLGLGLTLLIGPVAIRLARRYGLIDYPGASAHKRHKEPTPLAGGTILMVTMTALIFIFAMWRDEIIRTIFWSALIVYLFGLADDAIGLPAIPKLTGQLIASGILIRAGLSAHFLISLTTSSTHAGFIAWLDIAITVFWLVGITNAMNLIDSMDGLVAGLCIATFLFLMLATLLSGQLSLTWLSGSLASVCLALLFFNSTPAKLFLGDSGAQTLGFIAAAIAMIYAPIKLNPLSTWFAPILFLGVPIFDTCFVVFSRLKRHQPIYSAGLDHTYHRLVSLGVGEKRGVLILQMASVILGGLVFLLITLPPLQANIGFVIILLFLIGVIAIFEKLRTGSALN